MKRYQLLLLVSLIFANCAYGQFWGGFLHGLAQGAYMQQQQYYQRQQQQRQQQRRQPKVEAEPIEETVQTESNGFQWVELRQWNSGAGKYFYGAKDMKGKTIIPLSRRYTFICFHPVDDAIGYFGVKKNEKEGACTIFGREVITPRYENIFYASDGFNKEVNGEYIAMGITLDSEGKSHNKNSTSSYGTTWGLGVQPNWDSTPVYTAPATTNTPERSLEERRRDVLNSGGGDKCKLCKGTGKCNVCNGTKVASSFGNTYTCTVCDPNGDCSLCHGTGKSSWNR